MDVNALVNTKTLMMVVLGALVAAALASLLRRDRNDQSSINLEDLLLEDGKLSKAAAVMLGSFLLTTWVIVYLALREKLTEGYFTAYLGAWVAPVVARLIFKKDPSNGS